MERFQSRFIDRLRIAVPVQGSTLQACGAFCKLYFYQMGSGLKISVVMQVKDVTDLL